jgi:hypothetical protein
LLRPDFDVIFAVPVERAGPTGAGWPGPHHESRDASTEAGAERTTDSEKDRGSGGEVSAGVSHGGF